MTSPQGSGHDAPGPAIPGPGPAWFGSVMGTGGLAILLQIHSVRVPGFGVAAVMMLVLGWVLLLGLGAGFLRSVARVPGSWAGSVRDVSMLPLWGMVAMGLSAVGSATFVVIGARAPAMTSVAFGVDVGLWATGAILGVATAVGFVTWLISARPSHPLPTWALPVVAPMVSATSGGVIAGRIGPGPLHGLLVTACVVCFVLALTLGGAVIVRAYHHAWFRSPVPVPLATSTWIPLGIVGQSAAAAQVLAGQSLAGLARAYGATVLIAGAGLGAYAVVTTLRGFAARMPFSPGWWAMTYPLATCGLGASYLQWQAASLFTVAVLIVVWTLCAVTSVWAVASARARSGGPGHPC